MAAEVEEWGAWDVTLADGLDEASWQAKSCAAQRRPKYRRRLTEMYGGWRPRARTAVCLPGAPPMPQTRLQAPAT